MDELLKLELSEDNPLHGRVIRWLRDYRRANKKKRTLHQHILAAMQLYLDAWEGRVKVVDERGHPVSLNLPVTSIEDLAPELSGAEHDSGRGSQ